MKNSKARNAFAKKYGTWGGVLSGALFVGAALMFALDPKHGRRRRAMVRDRLFHGFRQSRHAVVALARRVRHRGRGLLAGTRAALLEDGVEDTILVERVRSRIGHHLHQPHSVEVSAHDGHVTLVGTITEAERGLLFNTVSRVHGVRGVTNRLESAA